MGHNIFTMIKYTSTLFSLVSIITSVFSKNIQTDAEHAKSFLKPASFKIPFVGDGAEVLDKANTMYSTKIARQLQLVNVEAYEEFTEHLERRIDGKCVDNRRRKDNSKDSRWGCGRKDDLKYVRKENKRFEECVSRCSEQDESDDWRGYAYEEKLEDFQKGKRNRPELPCLQCIEKLPKKFVVNQFRGTGKSVLDALDSIFNFGKDQSIKEIIDDLGDVSMPWEV